MLSAFRGEHDHRDVVGGLVVLQVLKYRKPAHHGQHDVQQNEVRTVRFDHLQGLLAVRRDSNLVTDSLQLVFQQLL